MSKILVISGHPKLEEASLANKAILDKLKDAPGFEVRDLKKLYPNFIIDVEAEQKALMAADVIVFQFPYYWYGVPGIMKEWMDEVLAYGFAYGSEGDKLKGKRLIVSVTIGGPEESYSAGGYNTYDVETLITPLKQMANLTGMSFEMIKSHGMIYIPEVYNVRAEVVERAVKHAERIIAATV